MAGKKALIFWGGWEGHTPERSAGVAREILERHGFAVRMERGTAGLTGNLAGFDLIVPMITMSNIEKAEVESLCAAVRGGCGLAGMHGLMCDSFRNETEYQFMTGGQWVAHPGNIIDYSVNIAKSGDEIVRGLSDFNYRSEQYYMHADPAIEVLATTTFTGEYCEWTKGVVMPVAWKKVYGKGRVFYSALGHTADEFSVPEMRTMFDRGMRWAAR
jgi:type 1 glutamine amidotransferase